MFHRPSAPGHAPFRPGDFDALLKPYQQVALLLQGGGALGSYHVGVYETLAAAGIEPTWISGVSIGAINTALIAGNPPERRLERLSEFWNEITRQDAFAGFGAFEAMRPMLNSWSALSAMALGQPGFFEPRFPNPWLMPRGSAGATSFYDTAALKTTLERLIDFDLLNEGEMRVSVGAVEVETGNLVWFDNQAAEKTRTRIGVHHIMASGALPPALPAVRIGEHHYWDGGIVSNTPLDYLLEQDGDQSALVFQVDLFPAQGPAPQDMAEVLARQKDITYSSRTRAATTRFKQAFCQRQQLRAALERIDPTLLTADEATLVDDLREPGVVNILHLIYRARPYERDNKDYEFSSRSSSEHRATGRVDAEATLKKRDWFVPPPVDEAVASHDIHDPRGE